MILCKFYTNINSSLQQRVIWKKNKQVEILYSNCQLARKTDTFSVIFFIIMVCYHFWMLSFLVLFYVCNVFYCYFFQKFSVMLSARFLYCWKSDKFDSAQKKNEKTELLLNSNILENFKQVWFQDINQGLCGVVWKKKKNRSENKHQCSQILGLTAKGTLWPYF